MGWGPPEHSTLADPHERCAAGPPAQAPFVGLGAVALDALTRREWVKEDELAEQLKVHPKVLRRVLRYLEQARRAAWPAWAAFLALPASAERVRTASPVRATPFAPCIESCTDQVRH